MRALLLTFFLAACSENSVSQPDTSVDEPEPDTDTEVIPDGDPPIPVASAPLYANTTDTLYEVDPETGELSVIGPFKNGTAGVNGMVDIAIDMDGGLFGGTFDSLWRIDPETAALTKVCDIDVAMYALAFTSEGVLVAGAGRDIQTIDVKTCAVRTLVSNSEYETSGDLVGLPDGFLYWSVRGGRNQPDELVRIDPVTTRTTWIGKIGYGKLFGMAYHDDQLYGFSSEGQTIRIHPGTAAGRPIGAAEQPAWWGATTNPVVWD
jgi:hypothetical protein